MMNALQDAPGTEADVDQNSGTTEETTPANGSTDDNQTGERDTEDSSKKDSTPVQIDQVFEILKNDRRRAVLRYMRTVDGEVRLGDLAEQIAAWECDKDVSQITSSERKRVYVGLYQSHLPKMADVDAISYNKPRGKIGPGKHMALFEEYLPTETDDTTARWADYHQAVLFGSVALVLTLLVVAVLL